MFSPDLRGEIKVNGVLLNKHITDIVHAYLQQHPLHTKQTADVEQQCSKEEMTTLVQSIKAFSDEKSMMLHSISELVSGISSLHQKCDIMQHQIKNVSESGVNDDTQKEIFNKIEEKLVKSALSLEKLKSTMEHKCQSMESRLQEYKPKRGVDMTALETMRSQLQSSINLVTEDLKNLRLELTEES